MDFQRLSQELNELIRPRTFPLGVRLIDKDESLPKNVLRPAKYGIRISMCQWTTMARTWGRAAAVLAEDINCSPCFGALGLRTLKDPRHLAQYFMDMGYFENEEASIKAVEQLDPIPAGTIHGVAISPLEHCDKTAPDLIWIYGTPAQMARLAAAWAFKTGDFVVSATTGFGISCLALVKPHFTGKPALVHPGRGERILAGTDEGEMAFSIPAALLTDLMDGLEKTHQSGNRYPIQKYVIYEPPVLKAMASLENKFLI